MEPLASEGQRLVAREEQAGLLEAVALFRGGVHHAEIARKGEAEIRLLAVTPIARGPWRRRGPGGRMHPPRRHLGCQRLVISTRPPMPSAQRQYERLRFVRAPECDWSKAGSPWLVYTLELDQGASSTRPRADH